MAFLHAPPRAVADCAEACQQCSADPAFIQPDQRQIHFIPVLREALQKKRTIVEFDDGTVVIVLDEACEGCPRETPPVSP
jgi:hypothetical protein